MVSTMHQSPREKLKALVGVEVSLLLSPLEMVRIQGQNCGKGGLLSASRAVAATGGLGVWGRGMTATMNREAKYCMGQFFLCDQIAQAVAFLSAHPPSLCASIMKSGARGWQQASTHT